MAASVSATRFVDASDVRARVGGEVCVTDWMTIEGQGRPACVAESVVRRRFRLG